MKSAQRLLALTLALLTSAALVLAQPQQNLLGHAQAVRSVLEDRARDPRTPPAERLEMRLRAGMLDGDDADFAELQAHEPDAALRLRAAHLVQTADYARALEIMDDPANAAAIGADLRYRWLFLREDLAQADRLTRDALARDSANAVTLWAHAELLFRMVRYREAGQQYEAALRRARTHRERAEAIVGLSKVYDKHNEQQRGLDSLLTLMNPEMLSSEALHQMGVLLIDLSRVSEAIDMFEEAVRWNPHSELAHYYLGNGYARLNYTQLREKYPRQFGDAAATASLGSSVNLCGTGQWEFGHVAALTAHTQHPHAVEPLALLGSIAWTCERMDDAAEFFRRALERCPEYGRAHNGLAKALEGKRLRINVHRAADSVRFAEREMPRIEKIETYVANWKSLSPRHRKQVALAVEPWKLYIPLLAESEHRHYIKPLHERLSESPGLETLVDQRISYDSRLWDDVRGAGGYTTVTGIEDVERSIYMAYNTVLHELTHQVHGVFPPEDQQRLTDRYRYARNLEAAGTKVFMSQYQAASVWEYFAEGANGYFSPRRDAFDTREITRERLFALDTVLAGMVDYYVRAPMLDDCWPVALVNAAQNALEQRNIEKALVYARQAHRRAPRAEVVLSELSFLHSLRNEDRKAVAFADSLRRLYPRRAGSHERWKDAHFFRDGDARAAVARLEAGLAAVDSAEEKNMRQSLGNGLWYAGRHDEAAGQYRQILARHNRDSNALWGLGLAMGDAGHFVSADSAFRQALLERSGITDLRLDYARVLIGAKRLADAERQIHEAELLSPADPQVLTLKGWLAAAAGSYDDAIQLYDRSIKAWPHDRLPQVLRVNALQQSGRTKIASRERQRLLKAEKNDIPEWKYHQTRYAYTPSYVWPAFQKRLLNDSSGSLP